MSHATEQTLDSRYLALTVEIDRLVNEDIAAAVGGLPIPNSDQINKLHQDRNILHAAITILRERRD